VATINKQKLPAINPQKPTCPSHQKEMRFDKSRSEWVCQELGCGIVARLKDDQRQRIDNRIVTDNIEPSKITLTMREDAEGETAYFIHAFTDSGLEFVIDVTNNVEMVIDDQTNSVSLCLLFHDVKRQHQ